MSGGWDDPFDDDLDHDLGDDLEDAGEDVDEDGRARAIVPSDGDLAGLPDEPDAPPPPVLRRRKPGKAHWTQEKMALFLRELAATQSVSAAARHVGMSRQSAYRLRDRLVSTPFSLGWDVALEAGLAQLAHAMMDRAVNGVEVPHYYKGEVVGSSRHYDERLAIWLMANPWKVGRRQMAREYSSEGWDRLLDRIETGPLDWAPGDELPGRDPPSGKPGVGDSRERAFMGKRSWYGGIAREDLEKRW